MKIAIIVCLARYYHRIQLNKINSFQVMFVALVILILPIMLVISQPDLGTSILIALSGLVVIWLAGINIRYFIYVCFSNLFLDLRDHLQQYDIDFLLHTSLKKVQLIKVKILQGQFHKQHF